jgi:hypothetical protein
MSGFQSSTVVTDSCCSAYSPTAAALVSPLQHVVAHNCLPVKLVLEVAKQEKSPSPS